MNHWGRLIVLCGLGGAFLLGVFWFFADRGSRDFSVVSSEKEKNETNVSLEESAGAVQDASGETAPSEEKKDTAVTHEKIEVQEPETKSQKENDDYPQKEKASSEPSAVVSDGKVVKKIKRLVSWGFAEAQGRTIDTIIVHSSYNALGGDKYDADKVIAIYKSYEVSPHYIIDRDGKILQLVEEKNIAYHAGAAKLPDGRTNVNSVSIGIEMLNDDAGDAYTDKQYSALSFLLGDIKKRYAIRYVLGHDDVAPGRKTDPWNFDWKRVK